MKHYAAITALALASAAMPLHAQNADGQDNDAKKFTLHGSLQTDILTAASEDNKIGTGTYDDKFMTNTYAELHLLNKYFQAGARLEYLDHPLPGFEKDFKGWGVPYFYIKGNYKWAELTLGDYYDQFGSGLIFRAYEERSLGVDNSLRGARLALKPFKGVSLKLIAGQQRYYWHHRNMDSCSPWTYGGDLELSVDQWVRRMDESGTRLTLGLSAVSNHKGKAEKDIYSIRPTGETDPATGDEVIAAYKLNMPKDVAAFDVRANLQKGNYNFLAEYAWKSQDPSSRNSYIYKRGKTLLLSGSYSKRGMSVLLQAKRSEDMAFRSRSTIDAITPCYINHLPAFSMQQTYTLAALYPYATQMTPGEWAFQGEVGYNFKRHTALGGKYGTNVKVNFSNIRAIDQHVNGLSGDELMGTDGYKSHFFKFGDAVYFRDVNVQIEKKVSKPLKLNFMYSYQRYNQKVVEGHGYDAIKSHIFIAEGKYQFSPKVTLRGEAQYLHTRQDQKDWWFGLLELSVLPNFMFTVSDQFNAHVPMHNADGSENEAGGTNKVHYLMGSVTYTHGAHRLQVGYGKTRAGYNCSGGVCRYVPASKGLQASYTFNF